jgi:type I restriction enzyme M protein
MNMILHGVHYRQFDIQQDDTLETPHHIEERFEAVVANPPFSANWSASQGFLSDERFQDYGKLAPKSKADFAFVQHMVHQLDENGTMAVVLPHGVLFRGAAEAHIRKHLIKDKNYLDAVIGLPANVFYGTSIPTCILVLKKHREHKDNILFIDASQHFGKATNQNYLRDEDLARILEAVEKRDQIEPEKADKFAYLASIKEIAEDNDYNLNIPRYVDTFEQEEAIDLDIIVEKLACVDFKIEAASTKVNEFCHELGIKVPFNE